LAFAATKVSAQPDNLGLIAAGIRLQDFSDDLFDRLRTASAAWEILVMDTPASVASWIVVVAARPKPCN
jgi:hypothetical protein